MTIVGVAPAHGHLEVLRTVVDTLQSSGQNIIEAEPELKGRAMVNWTRYVREVINARNLQGQTPLMLACQNGCAALTFPWLAGGNVTKHHPVACRGNVTKPSQGLQG